MAALKNRKKKAVSQKALSSSKLSAGSTILLKGGRGNKRKFNKRKAVVINVPTSGSWMTVKLVRGDGDSSSENKAPFGDKDSHSQNSYATAAVWQAEVCLLKWRKGGFLEVKQDPMEMFSDDVCLHIFSYLCGDRETFSVHGDDVATFDWVRKKAGMVHSQLRSVSRTWKNTFDRNFSRFLGSIEANLDTLCYSKLLPTIHWMCRHQLSVGTLVFSSRLPDIPVFCQLLRDCGTHHLVKMRAYVNSDRVERESMSRLIEKHDASNRCIDLTQPYNIPEFEEYSAQEQKTIHDIIAEHCPNLTEVDLTVTLPLHTPNYSAYVSTALFSMPSITKMKISFGYHGTHMGTGIMNEHYSIEGRLVTNLIENLPVLKDLELACPNKQYSHGRLFLVESNAIETLNVTGLGKGVYIKCKCPKLKKFRCDGSVFGNGTLPDFSRHQYVRLQVVHNNLVVRAGAVLFPHFEVPSTCEMHLEDWCIWRDFNQHQLLINEVKRARYETFTKT